MTATPEMSLEKDSLLDAIDKLKDDQEIHKEISVNGSEASSNRQATRKLDTHALVKTLMEGSKFVAMKATSIIDNVISQFWLDIDNYCHLLGFTLQQAEAITMTMVGVVDESTDGLRNFMVSKPQAVSKMST